jgi:pectinesterase
MRNFFLLLLLLCSHTFSFAQTANAQQYIYTFTVAQDGTGDYTSIQQAIDAIRVYPLAAITVYIKNGVYNEKINLSVNNTDVTFIGEDRDSTIITFNDYSGKGTLTTFSSYTAKISGNRFRAENITFTNTAGTVGQALALYVDADKAIFKNCKFLGNQDTIFVGGENSRQLFLDCYIEGTTDFIFGPATAIFKNCTIRCKKDSYITAANTTKDKPYGLIFLNCTITTDSIVTKMFLGRPWRAYAKTVFIKCNLPKAITPSGWDNWSNPENEKTVFYAEYKNNGEGAAAQNRVKWSTQLSDKDAQQYNLKTIFSAGNFVKEKDDQWYVANKPSQFNKSLFVNTPFEVINLYPGAIPNNTNAPDKEFTTVKDNVTRIAKVSTPTLTIFKPLKPNGKSVIVCPGGGYTILAFDKEGTRVAQEMNKWGVTVFVLKYRMPDDVTNIDKSLAPLQDAQQAIRFVRVNADKYKLQKNKIGIMGFSAGGHVASTAATHFNFNADAANTDTTSVRPNFAILIYPVISFDSTITHKGSRNNLIGTSINVEKEIFFSNDLQVTTNTPPTFLVHAGDDSAVPVENTIRFYQACIKNKVPAEAHLYPKGGHGFGLINKTTEDKWLDRLATWIAALN